MKFHARAIATTAIFAVIVAACGSTESDSAADRERNVDVAVPNAKFGPNESGIAVTPVKVTRHQYIATQSYKRQAAEPVVYGAITLKTHEANGTDSATVDLKIVRIILRDKKLIFDPVYNLKTLSGAEKISSSTEVVVTQNRTVLLLDRVGNGQDETVDVRRYMLATGKLDTTFGNKGTLTIDPSRIAVSGHVQYVIEGVDGSLFVGVNEPIEQGLAHHLLKWKGDGMPDYSFGLDGDATIFPVRTDFIVHAAHVVWENDDRGSIVLAATVGMGVNGYGALLPIRVTSRGDVNVEEYDEAFRTRVMRVTAGYDVEVGIDAMQPDTLSDDPSGNAPEQLVTRIIVGGEMPLRYIVYTSWVARGGFPGNRLATVTPHRFTDVDNLFAPDERVLGRMHQLSINGLTANVGAVVARGANFQGLALSAVRPVQLDTDGTLTSTIRLADYPSTRLTPTRLRVGTSGDLYFSQRAFSASMELGAVKDALVSKAWGVALDVNGLPLAGMASPVTESPINLAVSASTNVNVETQTDSVVTAFDETGVVHALYPDGDGLVVEKVSKGGALTRKGTPLRTGSAWGSPSLPLGPDLVVVRAGVLWLASTYTSRQADKREVSVLGLAKFDLATGAIDESFGDRGVSVIGIPQVAQYGTRPAEIVVNSNGSAAVIVANTGDLESKAFVLSIPAGGRKNVDLATLSTNIKPTIVSIPVDVLTKQGIVNGPIGFGVDEAGQVIAAQVRRELAYKTSPSRPDASFTVRIWRFGSNAQLDESFDGGYVEHDITGSVDVQPYMDTAPQVAVQADGKILIGLNGVRSPDTLVIEAANTLVREDVHVLARFTSAGRFDAIKAPAPKPVVAPSRIEALPTAPAETEQRVAVENPFTNEPALSETVITIPEVGLPVGAAASSESKPPFVAAPLRILATVSTIDRSIGVKWAVPASLATQNITYEVMAVPGGKTCVTNSTLCVFRDLEPWTAYSFTVAVKSGAEGVIASDPSPPAKPLRILARNKTVKTASLITPAAKGKLKWKVTGACKLSKDALTLTLPKDAATCSLSVRSPRVGKTAATTRSITIDVRAIVK